MSVLNVLYLRHGHLKAVYHVAAYVWQRRLLAEYETRARKAVLQWQSLYGKRTVFIDDSLFGSVNGVELYFVAEVATEC